MSEYKYYIKKIFQPAPDQIVIEAGDKSGRPVFNYKPGQYAMISYRNRRGQMEDKHAFSLASSPSNIDFVVFGIKLDGPFTRGLLDLEVGDELRVFGPYGNFCYDELQYPDAVMIAGGIGITPFFSALNYANDLKLSNKLALIYSARTQAGATFYPGIRTLQSKNTNLKTLFSFTEDAGVNDGQNVIHQRLDAKILGDFIGDISGKTFFICGPSLFMAAMVANLLHLGVSRDRIKMEEFSMIPDKELWPRLRNFSYAFAFSVLVFFISLALINKSAAANSGSSNLLPQISNFFSEEEAENEEVPVNQTIIPIISPSTKTSPTVNSVKPANTVKTATPKTTPAPVYTPPKAVTTPTPTTGASRVR